MTITIEERAERGQYLDKPLRIHEFIAHFECIDPNAWADRLRKAISSGEVKAHPITRQVTRPGLVTVAGINGPYQVPQEVTFTETIDWEIYAEDFLIASASLLADMPRKKDIFVQWMRKVTLAESVKRQSKHSKPKAISLEPSPFLVNTGCPWGDDDK